jgi:DNA ligase 4
MKGSGEFDFDFLCKILDTVEKTRSSEQKKIKIQKTITLWRQTMDPSALPLISLLTPSLLHQTYGVKESKLADWYMEALTLPKGSPDALALKNSQSRGHTGQDFGQLLFQICSPRIVESTPVSIYRVNSFLEELSKIYKKSDNSDFEDESSYKTRKGLFVDFVRGLSATGNKWFSRIILGNLLLGISDNLVLKCYHPQAPQYFNVCSNLKQIVDDLADPARTIKAEIKLGNAFRPMLAERDAVLDKMLEKESALIIEEKLDGERIQIHYSKEPAFFKFFSRTGNDYTYLYTDSLVPNISKLFEHLESCIVDGEMMIYDPKDSGHYLPYDTVKTYAMLGGKIEPQKDENRPYPCFVAFDIIYHNGQDLTLQPFSDRRGLLQLHFKENSHFKFVSSRKVNTVEEVDASLEEAINNRKEGIIVKAPNSFYEVGGRSQSWCKIKADYLDEINDTLDLVPVGAYLSSDKKLVGLLMAIVKRISDDKIEFDTLCKVSSGFSVSECESIKQQIERIEKPHSRVHHSGKEKEPDFWITPNLVIECKSHQLISTDVYSSGLTMRHPRFIRLRNDKSPTEATTLKEVIQMMKNDKKHILGLSSGKRGQGASKRRKVLKLAPGYSDSQQSTTSYVFNSQSEKEELLSNYEFYLHNINDPILARELQENGAKIVSNPGENTFCIIADKFSGVRLKNLSTDYDIIHPDYLKRCIDQNSILEYQESDILMRKSSKK